MAEILLDSGIRDWVLLPLCLITFLVGLLQQYATRFSDSGTPATEEEVTSAAALRRSQFLRSFRVWLFPESFKTQRDVLAHPERGTLVRIAKEKKASNPGGLAQMEKMMMNPAVVKMQLFSYLPYILMLMIVQSFFSGFILAKLPLSLHPRLKPLFQRDVDLPSLPAAYITSMCLYILLMTAYRALYPYIMSLDAADQLALSRRQQTTAVPQQPPAMAQNPAAQYEAESAALSATPATPCKLVEVEALIKYYPPGKLVVSAGEQPSG